MTTPDDDRPDLHEAPGTPDALDTSHDAAGDDRGRPGEGATPDPAMAPDPFPGEGDPVATGTKGGGEWPRPEAHPVAPAPGIDPARAEAIERRRRDGIVDDVSLEAYERDPGEAGSGAAPRPPAD